MPRAEGVCDKTRRAIYLRADLSGYDARRALLHEMCHVASRGNGHNKSFLRELRRLAERGESWAFDEAACYEPNRGITRADVRETMENLAWHPDGPKTWASIRQYLAHDFGLTPPAFDHTYPGLRDVWQHVSARRRKLGAR